MSSRAFDHSVRPYSQQAPNLGRLHHNAGSLSFDVTGSGPAVVLIHGFSLDRRSWLQQLCALSASFRVITYDCRGFGRSSAPAGPYSHAEDLAVLLRHIGVDSAHIVGSSMGGRIALNFALSCPELVETVALIGTDVGGYGFRIDWDVPVNSGDLTAARSHWLCHELFDTVRCRPLAWRRVRQMVTDYSGWHWQHPDIRSPGDTDVVDRLADVDARVIAIVGRHDLPDFHTVADLVAARVPRARTVVVEGAGHLVNLEAPTICNQILRRHFMGPR
ncbi:alpha/beta fold hydrolase [Nocardia barduliensis]|uniref:alpha/beta fold hydrolase n=1 Tax=Nocardia barduliensis TaxID=2736643 RepID=UPI001572068C|nr:alpha/beta hydrolase [Nocardia barduliensis]